MAKKNQFRQDLLDLAIDLLRFAISPETREKHRIRAIKIAADLLEHAKIPIASEMPERNWLKLAKKLLDVVIRFWQAISDCPFSHGD